MNNRFILILFLSFASVVVAKGQSHFISTSKELLELLRQDKEQGIIYLKGGVYSLESIDVRAGGIIRAYGVGAPLILGHNEHFTRDNGEQVGNTSWKVKVHDFHVGDFYVFDSCYNPISISDQVNGIQNIEFTEKEVEKLHDKELKIRLPIRKQFSELRDKDKEFFKNCVIKLTCWYVCMNVTGLYSDGEYVYGFVDSESKYKKLGIHPDNLVYATFFNYPKSEHGVYVDGQNYIHVPDSYDEIVICQSVNIFNLKGGRELTFEKVRFMGSDKPIIIGNNSRNKHFTNCVFENSGSGIDYSNYVRDATGNFSVIGCTFRNLYSNDGIYVLPVKNVYIGNNKFYHLGLYNKGGAAITVNGENYLVENNDISDFSYHGICTGMDQKYNSIIITGIIRNNRVDNESRYGRADLQLYDGGAIYVFTHVTSLLVEDNIISNFGFKNGLRFGLYLDGGAYNVTARNNLIFNMYPTNPAIHARFVRSIANSCSNNKFVENVVVGDCVFGGNSPIRQTELKRNVIAGEVKYSNDYIINTRNKNVSAEVKDGIVYLDRSSKIKKCHFTKSQRKRMKTTNY